MSLIASAQQTEDTSQSSSASRVEYAGGGIYEILLVVFTHGAFTVELQLADEGVGALAGNATCPRDRAPLDVGRANAVMVFAFSVVAVVATACAFGGRPRSAAPCVAIALAAAVIRGLDGYCTPLFYREIHAVSGSVAVLQWSGILAIWVVNAGVWLSLAVVLGVEN